MRQTKHTASLLLSVLMLLVWACGGNGGDPQTRAVQRAEALPAQPMENALSSMAENLPLPSSTANTTTTAAELEPDNTPAAMPRPLVTYLEEPIPPCTPIGPNGKDPCEAAPPPGTRASGSSMSALLPDPLPTISELVVHELTPLSAPHMVVRATGIPDTSRCDGLYPVKTADFRPVDEGLKHSFRYYCFTDFRVNEYIIGKGPQILTMKMAAGNVSLLNLEDWKTVDEQWVEETFDLPGPSSASKYEGKEYIIVVGISVNFAVETWEPQGYEYSMW